MTVRGLATLFVIVLAIGAAVSALTSRKAWSHDPYSTWHPPNNPGTSCCSNADCRPTRAYMGDDGLWRAWDGLRWLTVPVDRVLPTDYAGDGRNHLCEKEQQIYCFTPGEVRG